MNGVKREVVWAEGMSWWRLAERYLGSGYAWVRIVAENPQVCPVDVPVGAVIVIPADEREVTL